MSGTGRRTQYRKHLTDSVLFDSPEPNANELIAKVVATRGSNQFDVRLAQTVTSADTSTTEPAASEGIRSRNNERRDDDNETVLAILPTKFRTLVWVKRNDFVIVQCATQIDDNNDVNSSNDGRGGGGGIRYMISHILYKDQIHHLQAKGFWPMHDPEFSSPAARNTMSSTVGEDDEPNDDGIVYAFAVDDDASDDEESDNNNDDELFVNTNRVANLALNDSSSDDDE